MEQGFAAGRYEEGVIEGIAQVSDRLARHFPAGKVNPNELPDAPAVL